MTYNRLMKPLQQQQQILDTKKYVWCLNFFFWLNKISAPWYLVLVTMVIIEFVKMNIVDKLKCYAIYFQEETLNSVLN